MSFPDDMTWECHVCGRERKDENISVHKVEQTRTFGGHQEVPITANVRYCNDNPACAEGADAVGRRWLGEP